MFFGPYICAKLEQITQDSEEQGLVVETCLVFFGSILNNQVAGKAKIQHLRTKDNFV